MLNFFTLHGRHRWGLVPTFHLRFSFKGGNQEVIRVYSYDISLRKMSWVPAKGQGVFLCDLDNVEAVHCFRTTYRLGINPLPEDGWRENKRRNR
jgi:hypothetical protein